MATLDPIKLEFSKDNVVELIGCPAGEFMMGNKAYKENSSFYYGHVVKITRPFWMSKFKVTHKVYNRFQKVNLTDEDKLMGGWDRVHRFTSKSADSFIQWLNKSQYRNILPKGYVFRLPTWAEFDYALGAGGKDLSGAYEDFSLTQVFWEKAEAKVVYKRDVLVDGSWGVPVGLKKPNKWGFYDMIGMGGDLLLDTRDPSVKLAFADCEVDQLLYSDALYHKSLVRFPAGGDGQFWVNKDYWLWYCKYWHLTARDLDADFPGSIHIVIGPDLMKEKGYTVKSKKR